MTTVRRGVTVPPEPGTSRSVRDQLRYPHCAAHVTGLPCYGVGRSRRPTREAAGHHPAGRPRQRGRSPGSRRRRTVWSREPTGRRERPAPAGPSALRHLRRGATSALRRPQVRRPAVPPPDPGADSSSNHGPCRSAYAHAGAAGRQPPLERAGSRRPAPDRPAGGPASAARTASRGPGHPHVQVHRPARVGAAVQPLLPPAAGSPGRRGRPTRPRAAAGSRRRRAGRPVASASASEPTVNCRSMTSLAASPGTAVEPMWSIRTSAGRERVPDPGGEPGVLLPASRGPARQHSAGPGVPGRRAAPAGCARRAAAGRARARRRRRAARPGCRRCPAPRRRPRGAARRRPAPRIRRVRLLARSSPGRGSAARSGSPASVCTTTTRWYVGARPTSTSSGTSLTTTASAGGRGDELARCGPAPGDG